ncbi:hypothetical protein ACA910_015592 [Epithemia clementina (nom. ined.)]
MNNSVNSDLGDPSNLKEALNSNKAKEWKESLSSEYNIFMKQDAWKIVHQPRNARVLKTKNVCKTKQHAITKDIQYKVGNCVKGYAQIPGVDYTEPYAAVASDGTICTMVGISLYNKSRHKNLVLALLFDVEAAFLNAPLKETGYIEIPELFLEYSYGYYTKRVVLNLESLCDYPAADSTANNPERDIFLAKSCKKPVDYNSGLVLNG